MKKRILLPGVLLGVLLSGCSGCSRLPEIDFVGRSRDDVVRIFAANPEKLWGDRFHLSVPADSRNPYNCNTGLLFRTVEEALADPRVRNAPALAGYHTPRRFAIPGGWDEYLVVFDGSGAVVEQKKVSFFDGP